MKSIDDYAFYSCSGLSNIVFPKSLEYIGKYAFVGCRGLTGIVLPAGIRTIDSFAFAGLSNVTFYAQANERDADWIATWNPSYRPVVWGVTLSDDGGYVVKFTKNGNITNANAYNGFAAPVREGYTFLGWSRTENAENVDYDIAQTGEVPDGITLYAVWSPVQN